VVLRVKGSGTDLRTITRPFPRRRARAGARSAHGRHERSEMVDYLAHCLVDLNAKRPSIDALIHAFIDHVHVDHMHPDAIIALCTSKDGPKLMKQIYGDTAAWSPGSARVRARETVRRAHQRPSTPAGRPPGEARSDHLGGTRVSPTTTITVIGEAQDFLKRKLAGKKVFGGPKSCRRTPGTGPVRAGKSPPHTRGGPAGTAGRC